jgi:replicative DNA helicase
VRIWPTGFPLLDDVLGGGLRAGALNLLAGPQGQGKTTMALQIARNAVAAGRAAIFFSFELDAEALLQRLIALESGLIGGIHAPGLTNVRAAFEGADGGAGGLPERLAGTAGIEAIMRIQGYADRLVVHRSTTTQTDIPTIAQAVKEVHGETGQPPLIIVDYLQKVKFDDPRLSDEESITKITEQLKDLAIDFEAPVFAVAAADKKGLEPGQRMRARHLRGGTALAYEPDVVLIMNTKSDVVARNHLLFDVNGLDKYREWTVISVEKNRQGHDSVELEFRKRFAQGRFETAGKLVAEQLVEERIFADR